MPRIPLTADFIASVDQISHGGGVSSDTLVMVGIKLSGYKQIDFGFYEAVAESFLTKAARIKSFANIDQIIRKKTGPSRH